MLFYVARQSRESGCLLKSEQPIVRRYVAFCPAQGFQFVPIYVVRIRALTMQ